MRISDIQMALKTSVWIRSPRKREGRKGRGPRVPMLRGRRHEAELSKTAEKKEWWENHQGSVPGGQEWKLSQMVQCIGAGCGCPLVRLRRGHCGFSKSSIGGRLW